MRMGLLASILIGLTSASAAVAQMPGPNDGACCKENAFCCDPVVPNAFSTEPCCDTTCVWANIDFLYYWLKDAPVPPLVTTVNPTITVFGQNSGVLGQPNTAIAIGQTPVGVKDVIGGRVSGGFWFTKDHILGMDASYFGLDHVRNFFFEDSDLQGQPVLARPIINTQTGNETVLLVSQADQQTGSIGVTYRTNLFGGDVNGIISPWNEYFKHQCILVGFKYLDLSEELDINQTSALLPNGRAAFRGLPVSPPAAFTLADKFTAHNQFYGGQVGTRGHYDMGLCYLDLAAKLAFGANYREMHINGGTRFGTGTVGSLQNIQGGLLALTSNIGTYTSNTFAFVPEVEAKFGVRLTKWMNIHIGYNFLYWTSVSRPGDVVDRTINPTQLPTALAFTGAPVGPASPSFVFPRSDFWIHGASVGLGFDF